MADKNSVVWSYRASLEYSYLIDYLLANWGLDITEEIIEKINVSINRIIISPK